MGKAKEPVSSSANRRSFSLSHARGRLDRSRQGNAAAEQTQQQRERRARYGDPTREVVGGQVHADVSRPAEQVESPVRVVRRQSPPLGGAPDRIGPEVRHQRVGREERRKRERARRDDRALAFRPSLREDEVERRHCGNRREKNNSHNAEVQERARRDAGESEYGQRASPKRPVRQKKRRHKHREERQVLAVGERMGVQAGMQQEEQHCEQRDEPAGAEKPVSEQVGEEPGGEVEQVREQVSAQIDCAGVVQPEGALREQQRHLERDAVELAMAGEERVAFSSDERKGSFPGFSLGGLVPRNAVVI